MYWQDYLYNTSGEFYLGSWLWAFAELSGAFIVISAGAILVLHILRNKIISTRSLIYELASRYLPYFIFCLLMPPRPGDFWSNGGTEDILFIHIPVLLALSLWPASLSVLSPLKLFDAPLVFRAFRRAGLAALYAGLYSGQEGYMRKAVGNWDRHVALWLLVLGALPIFWQAWLKNIHSKCAALSHYNKPR
jgi:hypothetical protein